MRQIAWSTLALAALSCGEVQTSSDGGAAMGDGGAMADAGAMGDGGGQPRLSVSPLSAEEQDFGGHAARVQVSLSRAADAEVTVLYETSDGTAVAGEDYAGASGEISLPAGETAAEIEVEILGDRVLEGDETLNLSLAEPDGAVLDAGSAEITIRDDDQGPDVNDDGIGDLLIGAPGHGDRGGVFVFLGESGPESTLEKSDADVKIEGDPEECGFGSEVGAGDLNGDGFSDLIILRSRFVENPFCSVEKRIFIFFGGDTLPGEMSFADADVVIPDPNGLDLGGISVLDSDGDGLDDILLSAPGDGAGGDGAGAAYLFRGRASWPEEVAASEFDWRITGAQGGDSLGGIGATGDLNGDGLPDLVFGADGVDTPVENAGSVYVVFSEPGLSGTTSAADADVTVRGNEVDLFLSNVKSGPIDLHGDGRDDLVINSARSGGSGSVFIFQGGAGLTGTLSVDDADITVSGGGSDELFGATSAAIGDFDADGIEDLGIGKPRDDVDPNDSSSGEGSVYVLYGSPSFPGLIHEFEDEHLRFRLHGEGGELGGEMSGRIDFNGDGVHDLAAYAEVDGGRVYVAFGEENQGGALDAADSDVRVFSFTNGDAFGAGLTD